MKTFERRILRHRIRQTPGVVTPTTDSFSWETETNNSSSGSMYNSSATASPPFSDSFNTPTTSTDPSPSMSTNSSSTQSLQFLQYPSPTSTHSHKSHTSTSTTSSTESPTSPLTPDGSTLMTIPLITTTVVITVAPATATNSAESAGLSGSVASSSDKKTIAAVSSVFGFVLLLAILGLMYCFSRRKRMSRYARRGSRETIDSLRSILPKSSASDGTDTPSSTMSFLIPRPFSKGVSHFGEKTSLSSPSPVRTRQRSGRSPGPSGGPTSLMTRKLSDVDRLVSVSDEQPRDVSGSLAIDITTEFPQPPASSSRSRHQSFAASFWSTWSRAADAGDPSPDYSSSIAPSRYSGGSSLREKHTIAELYRHGPPPNYPIELGRKIAEQYPRPDVKRGQRSDREAPPRY